LILKKVAQTERASKVRRNADSRLDKQSNDRIGGEEKEKFMISRFPTGGGTAFWSH